MPPADRTLTIPDNLAYAAAHFPDNTAYVEGDRRVTWSEVHTLARDAAAGLIALGLQKGDRAAICAENSIDWIVAYHATVMAGAAAALVYFELGPSEIEEQIRRPACRLLFASPSVLEKITVPPCAEHIVILGDAQSRGSGGAAHALADWGDTPQSSVLEGEGAEQRESDAQQRWRTLDGIAASAGNDTSLRLETRSPGPEDLAAIIYTSGTTGGAKGVMLSHRNLMSNCHAVLETLLVSERDSVLLVLPMHHAMPFIATIVLSCSVGAHFVIENDLRRIRDRLQEHRPTIFFGVPALFEVVYRNVLARAEAEGRLKLFLTLQKLAIWVKRLTGFNIGPIVFKQVHHALGGRLRFLVSGGAALSPRTANAFFSLGLPLLQGWGMSEASPAVALQRFDQRRFRRTRYYESHVGSVGPALPGVEVKLVDVPDKGISVAASGEGEVLVRGENVFMGYWDAPRETAEALQDGWLRTGDLARIDAEGNIYLTGRSKYVIVLDSGEKVIPDELEDNLAASLLIEDVCVVGRASQDGRDRVQVTAVVYPSVEAAKAAGVADEASLQRLIRDDVEHLGRRLAAYKRIARIELTDAPLPKTALRKVARGHLADAYTFDYDRWLASAEEAPVG
ncbi:MAG TPA: AMP-binding protein [Dehalococcoidia bacterium]|nr:AMP-binding protein [Dehalococcoidia bacterium]